VTGSSIQLATRLALPLYLGVFYKAEAILEMADEYNLVMTTEEGMVTWKGKDQHYH
jgi:hypothetical protein